MASVKQPADVALIQNVVRALYLPQLKLLKNEL